MTTEKSEYTHPFYLLKTGSFAHPLSLTPLDVGSIKKCLTSSDDGSEDWFFPGVDGGGVATLSARPKAPGNEFESRTTNVPGSLSRNMAIAGKWKIQ